MADPVTAALMREAGQARRATDAVRAQDAVLALNDPNLGAEDSPAQRQERQAQIARQSAIAGTPPPPPPAPVAAPQQAANDPVTAALLGEARAVSDKSVPDQAPPTAPQQAPSAWDRVKTAASAGPLGPLEAGASVVSGAAGSLVGNVAGIFKGVTGGKYGTAEGAAEAARYAQDVAHSLTYEPRTEAGKEIVGTLGGAMEASKLQGLGPAEGIALSGLAAGPKALARAAPAATAAEAAPVRAPGQFGSVGASGASSAEQAAAVASRASPELQKVVNDVISKKGVKLAPDYVQTLERHVKGDTLPVPIKLTPGQATQNPALISEERNMRGADQKYVRRFNEQEKQLGENFDVIRDKAAPDVYATSKPEMGETIIDAYKAKDAALNKDISAKYKALKDANGGAFPLDAKAFVASADEALHKGLLYDHLPSTLRSTLDRVAKDGMTFENFESLRTNLARLQRSQTVDGNVKAAAGVVRDSLESLPLPAEAAHLKPLADAARAAARERFALIEADPAYKAITRGTASADKFISKYVIGADKKNVETMKANLAHDEVAQQTMAAGAMRRLKEGAGLTAEREIFHPAGYNKALESMGSKLDVLFDPESKALIRQLGEVAADIKRQPAGSFVNNSNTAVSLMAGAAKYGAAAAGDLAIPGLQAGSKLRKISEFIKEQKDLRTPIPQYGGIRLKDVGK